MLKRLGFKADTMTLTLVVWLCSLPLVAIAVIPFFGLKIAAGVAAGLLVFASIVCSGICRWPRN